MWIPHDATAGRGSSPPPNRGNPSPVWKKSGIASQAPENFYRVWGADLSAVALAKEDAPQAPANSKELPVAPARSGACSRSARPPSGRHAAPARPVRRSLGEGGPPLTWLGPRHWTGERTRNPMLLRRPVGPAAARPADRQPGAPLPQLPPRSTRHEPEDGPVGSVPPGSVPSYQSAHHSKTFPCMSRRPHAFAGKLPTGMVFCRNTPFAALP